jgi:hypothetical protein
MSLYSHVHLVHLRHEICVFCKRIPVAIAIAHARRARKQKSIDRALVLAAALWVALKWSCKLNTAMYVKRLNCAHASNG